MATLYERGHLPHARPGAEQILSAQGDKHSMVRAPFVFLPHARFGDLPPFRCHAGELRRNARWRMAPRDDAGFSIKLTQVCLPQCLRFDEGHFRLVAPVRLQPIQPKFQIGEARRIGLARQRLDKVGPRRQAGSHEKSILSFAGATVFLYRLINSAARLCCSLNGLRFQVPFAVRCREITRDSLVASFAIFGFRFLASVSIIALHSGISIFSAMSMSPRQARSPSGSSAAMPISEKSFFSERNRRSMSGMLDDCSRTRSIADRIRFSIIISFLPACVLPDAFNVPKRMRRLLNSFSCGI